MEDTASPKISTAPPDDPTALTLTGAQELRHRARKHVEDGAVTAAYTLDPRLVCGLLNRSLATELVCVLRYRRHHFMAGGISSESVAAEFLEHSNEEQGHADRIAARIVQLGGEPDFSPAGLGTRSHAEYVEGRTLQEMVHEDLVAERIAIESYTEMINFLGAKDPTTRRMLEEILAKEEEHAEDLNSLIRGWRPPSIPPTARRSTEATGRAPAEESQPATRPRDGLAGEGMRAGASQETNPVPAPYTTGGRLPVVTAFAPAFEDVTTRSAKLKVAR